MVRFVQYLDILNKLRQHGKHLDHQHFIIGNSSADYDSIFGSLIYGYMKYILFKVIFIPLIDCPKEDVRLRFEVTYAMQKYKIDYKQLFYHSEIPNLSAREQVLLYDHNVREGIAPPEIIDHHDLKDTQCKRKIVLHTGSALTLLYYTFHPEELPKSNTAWFEAYSNYVLPSNQNSQFDSEVDELIRMGIYLDTYNFDQQQKSRWTEMDLSAVRNIEQRAGSKNLTSFEELQHIKFDVKTNLQLPLPLLMKKDLKTSQYSKYQFQNSVTLLPPDTFYEHYGRQNVLKYVLEEMKRQNSDIYIIMFLYERDGKYQRQMTSFSGNDQLIQKLSKILNGLKMEQASDTKETVRVQHWVDPSNIISRKVLDKHFNADLK